MEKHDAGVVEKVIKKDIVKTTKGMYRLVGPPKPEKKLNNWNYEFYEYYMVFGFPFNF